jgi:5,10-methylenetetrahydromethanopterin reductase
VPLEITASGPRTLRAAGIFADRVMLSVGAAPERIEWAVEQIDAGLAEAGRPHEEVAIGALVAIVLDDSRTRAAERLRPPARIMADMSSLPGMDLDAQPEKLRRVTTRLRAEYEYGQHHVRTTAFQEEDEAQQIVDAEFASWWGIGGPSSYAVERLQMLVEKGLSYFVVGGLTRAEREALMADVFPHVRPLVAGAR